MTTTAPRIASPHQTAQRDPDEIGRSTWAQWPKYDAAVEGFRNYWYPVLWSRDVKPGKNYPLRLIGEDIMLFRDPTSGEVSTLRDRCPHRGVPLSDGGTQEFPGTFSCPYHGWTFDLKSGELAAVITDGPDSPICGKVFQRVFPTEERLGLVWVYIGDGPDVPPLEDDIPAELLVNSEITIGGRITERAANWRYGTENGYDEGHAKYLHRFAWIHMLGQLHMPAWSQIHIETSPDGVWATRVEDKSEFESDFPGLGTWPKKANWVTRLLRKRPSAQMDPAIIALDSPGGASLRMPGCLRILMSPTWIHYEWCIGIDADHYRYVQLAVRFKGGTPGRRFKAYYSTILSWIFHNQFTGQDERMVSVTSAPPERLYRPDVSIIGWRKLAENARTFEGVTPREPSKIDRPRSRELRNVAGSAK